MIRMITTLSLAAAAALMSAATMFAAVSGAVA